MSPTGPDLFPWIMWHPEPFDRPMVYHLGSPGGCRRCTVSTNPRPPRRTRARAGGGAGAGGAAATNPAQAQEAQIFLWAFPNCILPFDLPYQKQAQEPLRPRPPQPQPEPN